MRICLLAEAFYPVVGGAESHSRLLARELVGRGHGVVVVTRRVDTSLPSVQKVDGTRVYRVPPHGLPRWGKYLMIPGAARALYRLRGEYDLIYVCGLRVLGILGVVMAKILGKASVLRSESLGELDGDFARSELVGRNRALRAAVELAVHLRNRVLVKADGFISISSAISSEFRRAGVAPRQMAIIPNGVDTTRFRPAVGNERERLSRRLGLPTRWLAVYTGKLNRGKGLTLLLEAWLDMVRRAPDVHLLLVGSGSGQYMSCEPELREFVRTHDLDPRVTFTGYVENVEDYLRASDCFVLPSRSEAFGLSLVEAMACGLPSIATRVGGVPDLVRNGVDGLLVEPGNAVELGAALWKLYTDEEKAARLGSAAREAVVRELGIEPVTDAHLEVFSRLLGTGESPRSRREERAPQPSTGT